MESIEIPHKDIIRGRSITARLGPVFSTRGVHQEEEEEERPDSSVTRCTRLSAHAPRRTTAARKEGGWLVESVRLSKSLKLIRPAYLEQGGR